MTSDIVKSHEIASLIEGLGGGISANYPGYGWIPKGKEWRIRVTFGPECDSDVLADAIVDVEAMVERKLGALPHSCVNIDLNRVADSESAAVSFAIEFAKNWSSVVIDVQGHVLDLADLQHLQREGKGFGTDSAPPDHS